MINSIKNLFILAFSKKIHLKHYPFVSFCIIDQSLKIYGDDVNVNSLSGEILLPQMNKKYQKYSILEREKMLCSATSLIIYNCIYQGDFPNRSALLYIIDSIENGLRENKSNRWIKMHHDAYANGQVINKEFLLGLNSNLVDKLEIDRAIFEGVCGKNLIVLESLISENKNIYLDWIEEKVKAIQSS